MRGLRLGVGGPARVHVFFGVRFAGRVGRGGCVVGSRFPGRGLAGVGCCLVELFGKSLLFGSCGVEVGFCPFGADAERGSCFVCLAICS